jgi:hypothetical protein
MRYRGARYYLEVDAANFLTPLTSTLVRMYPNARFVLTIRDCFSWLDSRVEQDMALRGPKAPDWVAYKTSLYNRVDGSKFSAAERVLGDAGDGVRPVAAYLDLWKRYNDLVLDTVPADRLLVIRTEDLDDSIDQLASFAGVSVATLTPQHANRRKSATGVLAHVSSEYIRESAEAACAALMERYWGRDWLALSNRLPTR